MTGLTTIIAGIVAIFPMAFFFIWGLVQLFAVNAQVQAFLHIKGLVGWIASVVITYIPLLGSVTGFFGAKDVWGWQWWQAALLYLGAPIFSIAFTIVLSIVGAALSAVGSAQSSRARG